jgi:hemerythrin-like domain-containing protein
MDPTATLRREHAMIETALEILEAMAQRIARGEVVPRRKLAKLLEFFRAFADGVHHSKEEGILFAALGESGVPEKGPLAMIMREHDQARDLLAGVEAELPHLDERNAQVRFYEAAGRYRTMLSRHIAQENQILFPMIDQAFRERGAETIEQAFARHDREALASGVHERLKEWLGELEVEYLDVEPARVFQGVPA